MDEFEAVVVRDLISVDQTLSLTEQFENLAEPLKKRISEILALECTEESRQAVKKERALLRTTRNAFGYEVKSIKKQVLKPWENVENNAKELLRLMDEADEQLKQKVDDVEGEIKRRAYEEARGYFEEKRRSLEIGEWCTFESMRLPILLSDSSKKRMAAADAYLERVREDLDLIWSEDCGAECFDEYLHNGFSASAAVTAVKKRHERIAEAEASRVNQEQAEKRPETPSETVREALSSPRVLLPKSEEKPQETACDAHTLYKATFRVRGTIEQLKLLKNFISHNNIEILSE